MPSRIALCGLAGSGKSTAADYFVSRHKYQRLSYAAPIKRMMRALLIEAGAGLLETIEMTDGKLKELPTPYLCGHSTRYAMQTLGTEFGRDIIGQDIWRRILLKKVAEFPRVVVDDLRFPNEAESLKENGFLIVRIIRAEAGTDFGHSSEWQEFDVDLTITNDGFVSDLHAKLEGLL